MSSKSQGFPKWMLELTRFLPIRSQFVLSGNTRDRQFIRDDGIEKICNLEETIGIFLKSLGYSYVLKYDPTGVVSVWPKTEEVFELVRSAPLNIALNEEGELSLRQSGQPISQENAGANNHNQSEGPSLPQLFSIIKKVVNNRSSNAAIIIDHAAKLPIDASNLDRSEHDFFLACEKLSKNSVPKIGSTNAGERWKAPMFSPIFWITTSNSELPNWFGQRNERIHNLNLPLPDYEARSQVADFLSQLFSADLGDEEKDEFSKEFSSQCEGLTISEMHAISKLAQSQDITHQDLSDAVRLFRVGLEDNPWQRPYMRDQIMTAEESLKSSIKGQPQAIKKTVDILTRAYVGLDGAQSGNSSTNRPRGVMFLAGPTGVGKTYLAKSLTRHLFGSEDHYIRFDMSEFSAEHAADRLTGAPPGYVGYDAGGELTQAIRERPFSVILFDEIEKAHPRIMDKFLQILEDGRITDGRGDTVYFSECILLFTSNLGIFTRNNNGDIEQTVKHGEPYPEVDRLVRQGIKHHFEYELGRPEILNRFGDNIVVFNFISEAVAEEIMDVMLNNVIDRVFQRQEIVVECNAKARAQLLKYCTKDLSNGGRGIGNIIESVLINPLSSALFTKGHGRGDRVSIDKIIEKNGTFEVTLNAS